MSDFKNAFVKNVHKIWDKEDYVACMMGGAASVLSNEENYEVIKDEVAKAAPEDLSALFDVIGQNPSKAGIVPFITKARPDVLDSATQALGDNYGYLLEQKVA